ncbi:hypothetical protein C7380_10744 [Oceanotoga teriensis]|uniref:HTH cro/C1-type domain-containing protein n=1 Tax=Oceanotoga teriensis TaxID=515440 RepID=A0AA45C6Z6_9BACT|nr:hypothetical protein [Oceanotoga teriensis]PWJ95089.1 hypothetical protein C7380_10744 [Oceanotoga teriensis]
MKSIEKAIYEIHKYGFFAQNLRDYLSKNFCNKDLKMYIQIKNIYDVYEFENTILKINQNISKIKNKNIYYMLLGLKMMSLFSIKDLDYIVYYKILKKSQKKMPPMSRDILKGMFLYIESRNGGLKQSKFWGSFSSDDYLYINFLFGKADGYTNISKRKKILSEVAVKAKKIPNPSLINASLNNLLTLEKSDKLKCIISKINLYYASYYFSTNRKIINAYQQYIYTLKENDSFIYYMELYIFSLMIKNEKDEFQQNLINTDTKETIKKLEIDKSSYSITNEDIIEIKKYIKKNNLSKTAKNLGLSRRTLYKILNGETKRIKSQTIYKIMEEDETYFKNQIEQERFKIILDENIEEILFNAKKIKKETIIINILSTMMTLEDPNLNRLKRLIKAIKNTDIKKLKISDKIILLQATEEFESPFVKARKDLVKKAFEKIDNKTIYKIYEYYTQDINLQERKILSQIIFGITRFKDTNYEMKNLYPLPKNKHFKNKDVNKALWNIFPEKKREKAFKIYINLIKKIK